MKPSPRFDNMAIGTTEIAILVGAFVLLFGAKRIPDLARAMGLAKGEYQKAVSEVSNPSTAEQDMDRGGMTQEAAEEQ
ncbi:MAG: twin-arginine translocase TatA/TatE family subunit [Euryarchaeota archaeon]|jgi:sec-independent protein translocase protein TatA|nr:twin-arginine translocase TatA/TatE family subunit [Euryarchaeota archaeon]